MKPFGSKRIKSKCRVYRVKANGGKVLFAQHVKSKKLGRRNPVRNEVQS